MNKKDVVIKVFSELFSDCNLDNAEKVIETSCNNGVIKKDTVLCVFVLLHLFLARLRR